MTRVYIFLLSLFLAAEMPLAAQTDLQIEKFFDGRLKERSDVTEVTLKGRQIRDYGLTLFRSIAFPGNTAEARQVEQAVRIDTKNAVDKEAGMKDGRLYYGFYLLKPRDKRLNRYIFYRNNALQPGVQPTLTLIYMEGSASIEQLRRTFGNKK